MKLLSLLFLFTSLQSVALPMLKIGDRAPDFTIKDTSGNPINLYSLQGKIVLLDFWASWCGPCRLANKELVKIYKEYKNHGLEVFSVSLDSDKSAWIKAIEKDKLNWNNHVSDFKEWDSTPAQLYSITALPSSFLINEEGIIIAQGHDMLQIQLSLNEYIFTNTAPYPTNTSDKIFLSQKVKYEITDSANTNVLKGKDEVIDVKSLKEGAYTLKTENLIFSFTKVPYLDPAAAIILPDNSIHISDSAFYEVYNQRGILLAKGKGKSIQNFFFKPGFYHLNVNGLITPYEKKK